MIHVISRKTLFNFKFPCVQVKQTQMVYECKYFDNTCTSTCMRLLINPCTHMRQHMYMYASTTCNQPSHHPQEFGATVYFILPCGLVGFDPPQYHDTSKLITSLSVYYIKGNYS